MAGGRANLVAVLVAALLLPGDRLACAAAAASPAAARELQAQAAASCPAAFRVTADASCACTARALQGPRLTVACDPQPVPLCAIACATIWQSVAQAAADHSQVYTLRDSHQVCRARHA